MQQRFGKRKDIKMWARETRILGEFLLWTGFMNPAGDCDENLDFVAKRAALQEAAETTSAGLA